MRRYLVSIYVFVCFVLRAQDVHFSQFDLAPLTLNPAQAGVHHDIRAVGNYRDQWNSIGGFGYKTIGMGVDFSTLKKPGKAYWLGSGFSFYNDKAGVGQLSTLRTDISLSACIPSGKNIYSGGLQVGYCQKAVNTGDFSWDSQFNGFAFDASLPTMEYYNNPSFGFFSLSTGVNWYYSKTEHYMTSNDELKINMGAAAHHWNSPRQSFKDLTNENLSTKLVLYGNYSVGIHNKDLCILPSWYFSIQGPSRELIVGNLFKYIITEASHFTHIKKACAISAGATYRVRDALLLQTLFEYDRYAFGVAYDLTTSRLKTASRSFGGLEINFRFNTSGVSGPSKSRI